MSVYVYSTQTNSTDYTFYDEENKSKEIHVVRKVIHINGGANLCQPKTFVTPYGAVTKLSDEDFKELEKHPQYQKDVKAGFLRSSKSNTPVEKVVKDMTRRDLSAPYTKDSPEFKNIPSANGETTSMPMF